MTAPKRHLRITADLPAMYRTETVAEVLRRNGFTNVVIEGSLSEPVCDCGDDDCGCTCIPGNYPCEHGSAGEGC